jgi:hypothetical protein
MAVLILPRCGTGKRELRMNHQGACAFGFPVRAMLFLLFSILLAFPIAVAQTPGVSENGILIGSCSALDGPARFLGAWKVSRTRW